MKGILKCRNLGGFGRLGATQGHRQFQCNATTTTIMTSHLGRVRRYPSWQRMESPTSCATSCATPTADKSNHSVMGTPHPQCIATCPIRYTVLYNPPPKKQKCAPSLTEDINPQSSHWNNAKIKIVYNSAYVQIVL